MNRWRWLGVLFLSLLAGIAWTQTVVKPLDAVKVICEEEPSLSKDYKITRDGFIVMQFIGAVSVAGLREPAAAAKIAATLIEQRILPKATVNLKVLGSSEAGLISYGGAVTRSGELFPRKGLRLSDVIAEAKPTAAADLEKVRIIPANGEEIVVNATANQNPEVRAGDRVIFEMVRENRDISVTGMVNRPGVVAFKAGMTLGDVVTSAGGFAPGADAQAVRIERSGAPVADNNPATVLKAGDRVFVPQSASAGNITVTGAVARPGLVAYRTGITISQALSLAGGVRKDADQVKFTRFVDQKPKVTFVKLNELSSGMRSDEMLRAGDTLEVTPKRSARRGGGGNILRIAGLVVGGILFGILRP